MNNAHSRTDPTVVSDRQVLLSHPFGNANVRQTALAFAEADCLSGFRTCIDWKKDSPVNSLLPETVRKQLWRRTFPAEVSVKTRTRAFLELSRLAATRLGLKKMTAHGNGRLSVDAVARDLDEAVARELRDCAILPAAIYSYEDCASASFAAAKARGMRCFYDLPIGYWQEARAIQTEEAMLEPEWAPTITSMIDSPEKLARKDAELDLADAVFVASRYTATTLRKWQRQPVNLAIIPYGCPPSQAEPTPGHTGPLRVLFTGSLGQRKGTSYLLDAIEKSGKNVSLTLIGSRPQTTCKPLEAALQAHRWIPSLPHQSVLQEMRRHDVLVFPSIFEGFGLVILEALSQGIPVITTPHTGGPDVLTDGEDGYLVPIRDAAAIAEKLDLMQDRAHLQEMKAAALQKARKLTWQKYRRDLTAAIRDLLI